MAYRQESTNSNTYEEAISWLNINLQNEDDSYSKSPKNAPLVASKNAQKALHDDLMEQFNAINAERVEAGKEPVTRIRLNAMVDFQPVGIVERTVRKFKAVAVETA